MSSTVKSLIFWAVVLAAAVGVYQYAGTGSSHAKANDVAGEWLMAGKPDKPCAIFREGAVLMVVNERGDVASARMDGDTRLVIIKGDGWETGVTADLRDGGKSLAWRDGSVWERRER